MTIQNELDAMLDFEALDDMATDIHEALVSIAGRFPRAPAMTMVMAIMADLVSTLEESPMVRTGSPGEIIARALLALTPGDPVFAVYGALAEVRKSRTAN